jgi:membrane dipeptidase
MANIAPAERTLIVDGHEDLAWNALTFGREYMRSVVETRASEAGGPTPERNGNTLLGYPEWIRGQVAVIFATLYAMPERWKTGPWEPAYKTPAEARPMYSAQMDHYHRWVDGHPGKLQLIAGLADLEQVLATWQGPQATTPTIGLLPLMEGAEGIAQPHEVEEWVARGVRAIGPAWASNAYCGGTAEPGGLTPLGHELLEVMDSFGVILDLSHMDEAAAMRALDVYGGVIMASHANARKLVPDHPKPNRHLSDETIVRLAEREAVIGIIPYNPFLRGDWTPALGKHAVSITRVLDQIDYMCQVVGSAAHVGLGSDFDGGPALEKVPSEIDTIADLQLLRAGLEQRGFSPAEVRGIFGENWLRLLRRALR